MSAIKHHSSRSVQRGFSLIEVLVAVLILAIGLLGVAGVQVISMQNTSNANLRTQATIHAQDMAEQIRAYGGSLPESSVVNAWKDRMKQDLGPDADADISVNGDVFEIQIDWVERDAASTETGGDAPGVGRSAHSFTHRVEV